jgi:hypothetical protein
VRRHHDVVGLCQVGDLLHLQDAACPPCVRLHHVDDLLLNELTHAVDAYIRMRERRLPFECFPYGCPEPVLVKSSVVLQNGAKDMRFRTCMTLARGNR